MMQHYNSNITKALLSLFPDVDFGPDFKTKCMSPLYSFRFLSFVFIPLSIVIAVADDVSYRVQFFENYARDHSFDPKNSDAWQAQFKETFMAAKVFVIFIYLYK